MSPLSVHYTYAFHVIHSVYTHSSHTVSIHAMRNILDSNEEGVSELHLSLQMNENVHPGVICTCSSIVHAYME
jgi:hypothetical protein